MSERSRPITRDDVRAAMEVIESLGQPATVEKIRSHLGRGSLTTILKHRSLLRKPRLPSEPTETAVASFSSLWRAAHDAGAASRNPEIAALRSDLDSLSRECTRLEMAAESQAALARSAEGRAANLASEMGDAKAEARAKDREVAGVNKKLADLAGELKAERRASSEKVVELARDNARLHERAANLAQKLGEKSARPAKRARG